MKKIFGAWNRLSLVKQIVIGLVVGIVLAMAMPDVATHFAILGSIFVGALEAVAPILVFFLVMAAIAQHKSGTKTNMPSILVLYLLGTFLAGLVAVVASYIFPLHLTLATGSDDFSAPGGIGEVLKTLVMNIVDNPVSAIYNANYIGILAWAIAFGIALKGAPETTKTLIGNVSDAVMKIVTWVIKLAPFGVAGLVMEAITSSGLDTLLGYGKLLAVLVGCMVFVALVVNPLLVYIYIRQNPYPLVFTCLRESGITAFFTRSSAANIPVNMNLCKRLDLNQDTYSVSIPLGATINMGGAAVTISVLTLAAVHTLDIHVDIFTAILLSFVSAISAAGASGVAGGSLLLIPLAASLFGIPGDIAMKVVGVGFIVGVLQDSCETGLNSSTDALFTAAADFREKQKQGKKVDVKARIRGEGERIE